jgi:pantetheine-phosphate adenylyltransferase
MSPTSTSPRPRVAVFPGSFDPPTNGHVDIIERGCRLFHRVIVAVARNAEKTPLFSVDERVAMIREISRHESSVEVDTFGGLLVEYARQQGASALIRGLRAVSDFEYEFQMALMNRRLNHDLETVFLMPDEKYTYTSSRLIKEVFMLGGEVSGLVPPSVEERLRQKQASLRNPMAGTRNA